VSYDQTSSFIDRKVGNANRSTLTPEEYAPLQYWSLNQPWDIIITPHSYHTNKHHKQFADRVMEEFYMSEDSVTEIRGREGLIEVDQLYMRAGKPVIVDGELLEFTTTIEPLTSKDDAFNPG
jgi:hypothetical protein